MYTLNEIINRYGAQAKQVEVFTADNGRRFFSWHTDQITEHDIDELCGLEEVIDWQLMTLEEYNNTILANVGTTTDDYGWTDEDAPILCICVDQYELIPEDGSLVDRLCGWRKPSNPCLRWQAGDAVRTLCIESENEYNDYNREKSLNGIEDGICDVFGCGNDTKWMYRTMTDDEYRNLVDCCFDDDKPEGATISINNGLSECTPTEALAEYPLSLIAERMDDYWREWVHNNCEYANDLEYLEQYLKHSPYDIVIG